MPKVIVASLFLFVAACGATSAAPSSVAPRASYRFLITQLDGTITHGIFACDRFATNQCQGPAAIADPYNLLGQVEIYWLDDVRYWSNTAADLDRSLITLHFMFPGPYALSEQEFVVEGTLDGSSGEIQGAADGMHFQGDYFSANPATETGQKIQ